MTAARIAIVGAGVAGLSCATALREAGRDAELHVVVFEKSRGIGGRMATRRREGLHFDHGVPCVDGDAAAARGWVARAVDAGRCRHWPAATAAGLEQTMVGAPGMSDLCRPLAEGLDIRFETEIAEVARRGGGFDLGAEPALRGFSHAILTLPAPQAMRLALDLPPAFRARCKQVGFGPRYTLMVAFDAPPPWPDIVTRPPAPFEWIARESSKPGRPAGGECWVAHADEAWSRAHVEMERPEAAARLLEALRGALGPLPPVRLAMGHRWRYGRVSRPLGAPFLSAADGRVLAGGDWALGETVAHARESGLAMARAVLEGLRSA